MSLVFRGAIVIPIGVISLAVAAACGGGVLTSDSSSSSSSSSSSTSSGAPATTSGPIDAGAGGGGGSSGGNGADCTAPSDGPDNRQCANGHCLAQGNGGGHGGNWCSVPCEHLAQENDPKCLQDPVNFSGKCGGMGSCMVKAAQ